MTTSKSSVPLGKPNSDLESENASGARLLLICHGEGMQHRYSDLHGVNSGLTAAGWEQVEKLSDWLRAHEPIDALYCGSLLQSRLTAQRIGQGVGMHVSVLSDLPRVTAHASPLNQGARTGATLITAAGGRSAERGEAGGEQRLSLITAIDKALRDHLDGTVALITNAENIRAVIRYVLDANDTGIEIEHTSISCLRLVGDAWTLAYVNRRQHLPTFAVHPGDHREPASAGSDQEEEDVGAVIAVYNRVAGEDAARKAADDRERILNLLDFVRLPGGLDVLDVGTGLGVLAVMLAEQGAESVIGVDVSPGMLEQAEYLRLSHPSDTTGRVSFRFARLQTLPFFDERFDAVFCRLVLNHFRAPQRTVREIVRVLKPGGIFVMAELLSVDDPVKRATQNAIEERRNPSHVAARSAEQYNRLITEASLEIVDTASVSVEREMEEWLQAYRTPPAEAATVIEMVEAGMETDAAGINARRRGGRIEFLQRMYYLKAAKPAG